MLLCVDFGESGGERYSPAPDIIEFRLFGRGEVLLGLAGDAQPPEMEFRLFGRGELLSGLEGEAQSPVTEDTELRLVCRGELLPGLAGLFVLLVSLMAGRGEF